MAAIVYRDFYDVPRVFFVTHRDRGFLFDCSFSESVDDYSSEYDVYVMPCLQDEDLAGSWENIRSRAIRQIGTVPITAVKFDDTRRKEVDTELLDDLGERERLW